MYVCVQDQKTRIFSFIFGLGTSVVLYLDGWVGPRAIRRVKNVLMYRSAYSLSFSDQVLTQLFVSFLSFMLNNESRKKAVQGGSMRSIHFFILIAYSSTRQISFILVVVFPLIGTNFNKITARKMSAIHFTLFQYTFQQQ